MPRARCSIGAPTKYCCMGAHGFLGGLRFSLQKSQLLLNILSGVDPKELLLDSPKWLGNSKVPYCHTAMKLLKKLVPKLL